MTPLYQPCIDIACTEPPMRGRLFDPTYFEIKESIEAMAGGCIEYMFT